MSDDTIPTVKEELERKTVDLLESLVSRSVTGRLNTADLAMVGRALWNVTSGLVSGDVSDMCAAVADSAKPRKMVRHFVGKGQVISVIWLPDSHGYLINTRNATDLLTKLSPVKTEIGLREDELQNLFGVLARSGYIELPT